MHQDLILHFLKATSQNQDIYPLLIKHLDKLDNSFAAGLREVANRQFAREPANAINIARVDRKSTRLNSSHVRTSRMPSSA